MALALRLLLPPPEAGYAVVGADFSPGVHASFTNSNARNAVLLSPLIH
jgi:hypothetical protein